MISNPRGMIPQPVFARCLILVLLLARGAAAEAVVLRHVTIVDRGTRRADATLVVDQGKIASIGAADAEAPRGARVVDCAGQFVIPGLWDMHVHLSFAGEPALLDLVAAGVTGVRDMGGDVWQLDGWRREIAEGVRIGPTIVQAGPLLDGPKPGLPHRITVASAEDGRQAVAVLKRGLHVDFVKVHNGLARDAFFAVAAEAKKQGLPLACHLPTAVTAEEASSGGCKSIEHIAESIVSSLYLQQPEKSRSFERALDDLTGPAGARLFALFARNGTWVDPTLAAFQRFADTSETSAQERPRTAAMKRLLEGVARMRAAGVKLLAGSDMAGSFWPTDVHDELRLLVQAGLSPAEALASATSEAAAFLGLQDETGSVVPGKAADLVLLRGDPLADIRNTRAIAAVVVRGRYFSSDQVRLLAVGARSR